MAAPHQRLEGTPYVLERVLGAGAMGEVWLGEHVSLRRPAVIKLIHARFMTEPQVVARMRREARIVANLRHEALVTVYDLGETADGRTYIAMEWLDGAVLRDVLRTRGALPAPEACRLAIQALDGLHVAHQAGVVHRDVKPENLFVTRAGVLKVLDFGVAKPMQEGDGTGARTAAGMVLGTPRYMAPEQAIGRALSAATDVYALGCVLFELCAGRPVFDGSDARDLLWAHVNQPAPTLAARTGHAFDPRLETILARALQKDAVARYPTAAEMADAIRALFATATSAPPPPSANATDVEIPGAPTVPVDLAAVAAVAGLPTSMQPASGRAHEQQIVGPTSAYGHSLGPITTERALVATPAPTPAPTARAWSEPPARTQPTERLAQEPPTPVAPIAPIAQETTLPTQLLDAQLTNDPLSSTMGLGRGDTTIRTRARPIALLVIGAAIGVMIASVAVYFATRERSAPTTASAPATRAQPTTPATNTATEPATASAPAAATASAPAAAAVPATVSATATATATATAAAPVSASAPASASATASASAPATASATAPAPPSHYELARQAMADGDLDLAEREARLAGSGTSARLLLGEILERRGKTALAKEIYRQILASDPDQPIAKTRLARLGG
jgi:serine/threonine-protein kinase